MVVWYAVLVLVFNKLYRKANKKQMEDNAQLKSYLVESLDGIQTVKAFNGEPEVQTKTEFKSVKLLRSIFKLACIGNAQEGLKTFVELVGAQNVLQGNMTIGDLVAFNALLVYFLDPVKNLINLQPTLQTAIVAPDRLGEILDLDIEKDETQNHKVVPSSLKGNISIRDISFCYGTRRLVLDHFSMDIKEGQNIAIVGESGAGKTTIAKLLLNLYQYESGTISIADYALPDIQLDALRERLYIFHRKHFFSAVLLWIT